MLFADRIDRVAILAGGVLATVAMWAFGYLSHLPGVMLPGPATLAGLTLVLLIAGRFVGAHASPGVAAAAGGVAGLINLLVLGSLLGGDDGRVGAEAAIWVPASILVHALVAWLGTVGVRRVQWSATDWHGVMAAATLGHFMTHKQYDRLVDVFCRLPIVVRALSLIGLALLIKEVASFEVQPFIYFQF